MSSELAPTTPDWELRWVGFDHPDAVALTAEVQRYYVQLYGGTDASRTPVAEFAPPDGHFAVGYLDGVRAAMGGWRFRPGALAAARRPAELKRMYVVPTARRHGLARRVLGALEDDAAAAGADWLVLESGAPQTAAIAFSRSAGYADVPGFGLYADSPNVVNLGKRLG